MRITQGTFSFLPDLTDDQISKQINYIISQNWAINIEYTEDPHPRNNYWELWGLPLFEDNTRGTESCVLSFIVNRPAYEPGFELVRSEDIGRNQKYCFRSYATAKPEGSRY